MVSYQKMTYYYIMILRNFVVFEGLDGTGTTTQLKELEKRFRNVNRPVHFTAEPTDRETGKIVRKVLSGSVAVEPETLARLFAADRGEHVYGTDGILSHLESGKAVFTDRYVFSSLAYQSLSCDPLLVKTLNEPFPLPELLFFFDIDPELAMTRVHTRGAGKEIFETTEFQQRVRDKYREILDHYGTTEPGMTIVRINAAESIETITENIWSLVENLPKL